MGEEKAGAGRGEGRGTGDRTRGRRARTLYPSPGTSKRKVGMRWREGALGLGPTITRGPTPGHGLEPRARRVRLELQERARESHLAGPPQAVTMIPNCVTCGHERSESDRQRRFKRGFRVRSPVMWQAIAPLDSFPAGTCQCPFSDRNPAYTGALPSGLESGSNSCFLGARSARRPNRLKALNRRPRGLRPPRACAARFPR